MGIITINDLIDKGYFAVSVFENMRHIDEWLYTCNYFAVKDENLEIVGIVTQQDVLRFPNKQIMDVDISKPRAYPGQSVFDAYRLMEDNHTAYLPVYSEDEFIGVISLEDVTKKTLEFLRHINY